MLVIQDSTFNFKHGTLNITPVICQMHQWYLFFQGFRRNFADFLNDIIVVVVIVVLATVAVSKGWIVMFELNHKY